MAAPARIRLVVTSKSFSPKLFAAISEAASATGLSVSSLRNAYHLEKKSMRRKDGEVFTLEWKKPCQFPFPEKVSGVCIGCSTPINFKDKARYFAMFKLDRFNILVDSRAFYSIAKASRWSGVSICSLRNACEKGNPKVTRRKGEVQRFWIKWNAKCFRCSYIGKLSMRLQKKSMIGR